MFESFGFISASFFKASDPSVVLDLADGKTAQITAPIPYTLMDNAPDTIPMWYYDESTGKWMEQGTGTKVGNNYVGDVSHFTYWNFDHPHHSGCAIHPHRQSDERGPGEPVAGAQVVATGINYSGYNRVYSDADGNFSIPVKASATCTLQAFAGINSSTVSDPITTPAAGGTLAFGDIIIADLSFTITGKLETASGDPLGMGTA
jgi:hypothetical protein